LDSSYAKLAADCTVQVQLTRVEHHFLNTESTQQLTLIMLQPAHLIKVSEVLQCPPVRGQLQALAVVEVPAAKVDIEDVLWLGYCAIQRLQ
jgi:hypothetical protein